MAVQRDSSAPGRQIQSNLDSIVDIAEKWLRRLRGRRKQVKLATAFLTTLLVFFGFAAFTFGYILTQYSFSFFSLHPSIILTLLALIGIASILSGVVSYFGLGRKQDARLDELAGAINEIKKRNSENHGAMTADVLSFAEKIITLLPELVRKRNQDSFLFGIVAFVLTVLPAKPPLALLIGVLVWLFFRYEMNKDYEKEVAKFEEQRQIFERRKQEFLETL
ncbi:MAG: hypothetical protein OK439_07150 [Thaumarchaeota archaeon]|nr:hypothetical protein [Nitrososphaerota archaeon]